VTLFVQMANLSETGAFIKTATPLEIGATATVKMVLPNTSEEIEVVGRVIWNRRFNQGGNHPPGMAIKFTKVDELFKDNLKKFLMTVVE